LTCWLIPSRRTASPTTYSTFINPGISIPNQKNPPAVHQKPGFRSHKHMPNRNSDIDKGLSVQDIECQVFLKLTGTKQRHDWASLYGYINNGGQERLSHPNHKRLRIPKAQLRAQCM
jgi:hypothetical protein